MRAIHCALIVGGLLATTPAIAKDHLGYVAIQAGDYATAERTITAERRIFPDMPELLLNLATVYTRTGRAAQARDLYLRVLKEDDVMLDLPSASGVSSHALARAGLAKLTFASR